jgi:hypothetical protein
MGIGLDALETNLSDGRIREYDADLPSTVDFVE